MRANKQNIPTIKTRTLYRDFKKILDLLAIHGQVKLSYRNRIIATIKKTKNLNQLITNKYTATNINQVLDQISGIAQADLDYKRTYKEKLQRKYE